MPFLAEKVGFGSICKCAVFEFRIRIKQRTKRNTEIDIGNLLELKSMSKLKTLIRNYLFVNYLEKELPHLHIDTDLDSATCANPNAIFGRKGGIWEIECKPLNLFANVQCSNSESE